MRPVRGSPLLVTWCTYSNHVSVTEDHVRGVSSLVLTEDPVWVEQYEESRVGQGSCCGQPREGALLRATPLFQLDTPRLEGGLLLRPTLEKHRRKQQEKG